MSPKPGLAITRSPSPAMTEGERTHLERVAIDPDTAIAQHAAYRAALAEAGYDVMNLAALDGHGDCAFVEDMALAFPQVLVLCRSGATSRRGEQPSLAAALPGDRPVVTVEAPATIDGGDVLSVGRDVFVGVSSRTNAEGAEALRVALAPFGYRVTPVPLGPALHLKTAVTALADDLLLLNPAWLPDDAFADFRRIEVAPEEPFAANILRLPAAILCQSAFPATAMRIADAGFAVESVDTSELAKAEAGLTCMSLLIPPPAH